MLAALLVLPAFAVASATHRSGHGGGGGSDGGSTWVATYAGSSTAARGGTTVPATEAVPLAPLVAALEAGGEEGVVVVVDERTGRDVIVQRLRGTGAAAAPAERSGACLTNEGF